MGMVDGAKLQEMQQQVLHHWRKVHTDLGRRIADGFSLSGIRQAAG